MLFYPPRQQSCSNPVTILHSLCIIFCGNHHSGCPSCHDPAASPSPLPHTPEHCRCRVYPYPGRSRSRPVRNLRHTPCIRFRRMHTCQSPPAFSRTQTAGNIMHGRTHAYTAMRQRRITAACPCTRILHLRITPAHTIRITLFTYTGVCIRTHARVIFHAGTEPRMTGKDLSRHLSGDIPCRDPGRSAAGTGHLQPCAPSSSVSGDRREETAAGGSSSACRESEMRSTPGVFLCHGTAGCHAACSVSRPVLSPIVGTF